MSSRKLSDSFISALPPAPPGKRRDIHDTQVPGLLVRVTDRGTKSLMLYAKFPNRPNSERRLIGRHGAVSIERARVIAREWHELLRAGKDPQAEAERVGWVEAREQEPEATFGQVVDEYISHIRAEGQRKAGDVERRLRTVFVPVWGERPISSLELQDVRAIIAPIVKRGAKYRAHNVFGDLRTLFRWAIGTGAYGLKHSPCDHLQPKRLIGKKSARTRVLDDDELRAFWTATERLGDARIGGYPWRPLLRLLLLTGQRKTELSDAQWQEFDLDQRLFIIPEQRFKSGATHVVPLSAEALAIIEGLPRPRYPKGNFIFSTTDGAKPVDGFSKMKAWLDKLMSRELRELRGADAVLQPWILHDLRRTARTRWSWLGIPSEVCEKLLGHEPRDPLVRVYNRHQYLDERRAALDKWAAALKHIVQPTPAGDNVVQLRERVGA
jgi:integrase